jgi:hypothetical protein
MNSERDTEEKARQLMVEKRMHAEQVQSNMLERGIEQVDSPPPANTSAQARESIVQDRQQQAEIERTMQERTLEEIEDS